MAIFDKPQWRWARSYSKRLIANLSNEVEVTSLRRGKATTKKILANVPLALFTLLRDVARYNPSTQKATLYADVVENEGWVFGVYVESIDGTAGQVYDLWRYKKLPAWLNPEVPSVPSR